MNAKEIRIFLIGFVLNAICFTFIQNTYFRFISCYIIGAVCFYMIFVQQWPRLAQIIMILLIGSIFAYAITSGALNEVTGVLPDGVNTSNLNAQLYFAWFETMIAWGILKYLFNKFNTKEE